MTAIVDYDAGNVKSVEKAVEHLGFDTVLTKDRSVILSADHVIVPGVGAFGDAVSRLHEYDLFDTLGEVVASDTPILGICLGMQLFFEKSEEAPEDVKGLGFLPGSLYRFPETEGYKIPQIGWNRLRIDPSSRLFKGIDDGAFVYFVHSYYLKAQNETDVAASAEYMIPFHAACERGNIFATQFHPEKSGEVGLKILKNFLTL